MQVKMIFDKLKNLGRYRRILPQTVIRFLQTGDFSSLPIGKTELDGKYAFVMRSVYETSPHEELLFEEHGEHIDIHVVCAGSERIGICPTDMGVQEESGEDCMVYQGCLNGEIPLLPDDFLLLFPGEAHKVKITHLGKGSVDKLVVKLLC